MKRTSIAVIIAMTVAMCMAQAQSSQGGAPDRRTNFGSLCGIGDTDAQRAVHLVRSGNNWSIIPANKKPGPGDDMAARVWREKNWMVDLNDTPPPTSPVIHSGQMCFDPQGRLTRMIDRYTELAECRCMRFTTLTFNPDGTVKQQQEQFMDEMSGMEIGKPDAAKGFPGVWQYRRLEQLPFYSLIKK